jgi:hypothetical protein
MACLTCVDLRWCSGVPVMYGTEQGSKDQEQGARACLLVPDARVVVISSGARGRGSERDPHIPTMKPRGAN